MDSSWYDREIERLRGVIEDNKHEVQRMKSWCASLTAERDSLGARLLLAERERDSLSRAATECVEQHDAKVGRIDAQHEREMATVRREREEARSSHNELATKLSATEEIAAAALRYGLEACDNLRLMRDTLMETRESRWEEAESRAAIAEEKAKQSGRDIELICAWLRELHAKCEAPEYSSDLSAIADRIERGEYKVTFVVSVEQQLPLRFTLLQASNGYSIALAGDSDTDEAWARIEAAGDQWPYLFRATWNNRHTAKQALRIVREKFGNSLTHGTWVENGTRGWKCLPDCVYTWHGADIERCDDCDTLRPLDES